MIFKCTCVSCNESYNKLQKCIQCTVCTKWVHLRCVGISHQTNFNFCPDCLKENFPFHQLNDIEMKLEFTLPNTLTKSLNSLEVDFSEHFPVANLSNMYRSVDWLQSKLKKQNYCKLGLSVIHLNVRSLPKNKNLIEERIRLLHSNIDVIGITETKLNSNNCKYIIIKGYNFVNINSSSNAGGVALFINDRFKFTVLPELSTTNDLCETAFIEVNTKNSKKGVVIGVVYRHPRPNINLFQEHFLRILGTLSLKKHKFLICGDFNIALLKHYSSSKIDSYLSTHLYSEFCFNLITKPTRITSHSSTLLDHLYTNMLSKQITSGILTHDISDHLPTFCIIPIKVDIVEQTKTFRCAKNFNVDDYVMDVENLVSDSFIDCCNNNGNEEFAFNNFINGFSNIINHHLPIKTTPRKRRKTNHKLWLKTGILNSIKTKNKLFRKSYKQNNVQLTTFYKNTQIN